MSKHIDGTTISVYEGDSFSVTFEGLEPGSLIYFGVRDKKYNNLAFDELHKTVGNDGNVTFDITAADCDKCKVKPGEPCAIYYYGIKRKNTETGDEDTIILGDEEFATKYILKVLPKKVEG